MTRTKAGSGRKRFDVYQAVTDQIVAQLEQGVVPWKKSWEGGPAGAPANALSKRPYSNVNRLNLLLRSMHSGYTTNLWCTYNQAVEKGWQVRKGEHGAMIVLFKPVRKDGPDTDPEQRQDNGNVFWLARAYTVFNLAQMDGVADDLTGVTQAHDWEPSRIVDDLITASGAEIVHAPGLTPAYDPSTGQIRMPPRAYFFSMEDYAATVMHELAHWTGHPDRLDRHQEATREGYAKEELRAEIASAMLSSAIGLNGSVMDHAGYLAGYLSVLQSDKHEIFRAARDASGIADYIMQFAPSDIDTQDDLETPDDDGQDAAVMAM